MKRTTLIGLIFILISIVDVAGQLKKHDFRIRTITTGVTLMDLTDTTTLQTAIRFLRSSRQAYVQKGYEVQTIRISTQNFHQLISTPDDKTIALLKQLDALAVRYNLMLSIGELLDGNQYQPGLAEWVAELVKQTSNISFSVSIASVENGIHHQAIKSAAEICKILADSPGGEANFRFTASANCPPGIPFFPAAFHEGVSSFAVGLEYPNLINKVFKESHWENAAINLKSVLEKEMRPIEVIAKDMANNTGWRYDGIDTSPAPGLDASIGQAIEALTKKPFGGSTTLTACAIITGVIKNLDIKKCGYSGLMLPVIEDQVLARRANEGHYTLEELLLFSAVSGTGLDVVPIPGNTSVEALAGVYTDVAALSLKYTNKALSARLFPIPGRAAGDLVSFENPFLTAARVMKLP